MRNRKQRPRIAHQIGDAHLHHRGTLHEAQFVAREQRLELLARRVIVGRVRAQRAVGGKEYRTAQVPRGKNGSAKRCRRIFGRRMKIRQAAKMGGIESSEPRLCAISASGGKRGVFGSLSSEALGVLLRGAGVPRILYQ